jgi:hypothetical protein
MINGCCPASFARGDARDAPRGRSCACRKHSFASRSRGSSSRSPLLGRQRKLCRRVRRCATSVADLDTRVEDRGQELATCWRPATRRSRTREGDRQSGRDGRRDRTAIAQRSAPVRLSAAACRAAAAERATGVADVRCSAARKRAPRSRGGGGPGSGADQGTRAAGCRPSAQHAPARAARHQLAMPAQKRRRRDTERPPSGTRQHTAEGGQHNPIARAKPRSGDLTLQHP